jgi:hypothetical protein
MMCSNHLGFDAVAAAEVPDFLPITSQCISHGPCPTRRITLDQIEASVRSVSPVITHVPAVLTRQLGRRMEDFHHRCNQEIKGVFASAFSAGNFAPQIRDDYRNAIVAFFTSRAGRSFVVTRSELSVSEAAAPYSVTMDRLRLAPAPAKKLIRFMESDAGRWWAAARLAAWQRLLHGKDRPQPQQLCSDASQEFEDARLGAIVRAGLTEPIIYRKAVRRSLAR